MGSSASRNAKGRQPHLLGWLAGAMAVILAGLTASSLDFPEGRLILQAPGREQESIRSHGLDMRTATGLSGAEVTVLGADFLMSGPVTLDLRHLR